MEGEQGHASELEVFKMLGRCVKETFLEYLPPHSYIKHGGGTKRKYDSVVGPRPRPLRPQGGSEPRIRKRTKITLPPVRDSSPFTTPHPASSSPRCQRAKGCLEISFRPPTFTAPLFEEDEDGYESPMFSGHPFGANAYYPQLTLLMA